MRIATLTDAVP